jgi:hypothetical protein
MNKIILPRSTESHKSVPSRTLNEKYDLSQCLEDLIVILAVEAHCVGA